MNRHFVLMSIAALAAGCSASVKGTVTDGMSGAAISGVTEGKDAPMRLIAKAVTENDKGKLVANPGAGMTCMTLTADVGTDGAYQLDGLCLSATAYSLELTDKNLFLGDIDVLAMGHEGDANIKVWRTPGSGVFTLANSNLSRVGSNVDLQSDTILNTEEKVWSPKSIPPTVPLVVAGEYLVLGGVLNKDLQFLPLINSSARKFGNDDVWTNQAAWAYIGTSFASDTEYERKATTPASDKVIRVEKRGSISQFVGGDALPAGRYMVMAEGADRGMIVDFGTAGEIPSDPPEEVPEEG